MYIKHDSRGLSINTIVVANDLQHIQMTEVPKAYFTTIKKRNGEQIDCYDNLLQVTIRAHGMIFDLDSTPIKEVESIENIDSFTIPDTTVNTGFIMSTSKTGIDKDENPYILRNQIFTNEHVNLIFQKTQKRQGVKQEIYISGMLFRTFSEIDLFGLKEISDAV